MDNKSNGKSRGERRKEARLEKKKKKFDSWAQHKKSNKKLSNSKSKHAQRVHNHNQIMNREEIVLMNSGDEDTNIEAEHILKQDVTEEHPVVELNDRKRKKDSAKKSKSKFEEYLKMEMNGDGLSANEDLKLETKLAKKLKVKGGKLPGLEDDITMLLEGIPSALDSLEGEESSKGFQIDSSRKKRKKSKSVNEELGDERKADDSDIESRFQVSKGSRRKRNKSKSVNEEQDDELKADHGGRESGSSDSSFEKHHNTEDLPFPTNSFEDEKIKTGEVSTNKGDSSHSLKKLKQTDSSEQQHKTYVPPHLRSRMGSESEEYAQIRRRIRGLLNRMSESNVESITGEISTIFRSVGRSMGSQIIVEEVLASCSGGPRGNEQYAAVFSAFVAGMACMVGIEFGAKLLASLAKCFEDEYLKEDNLSLRNLTLLLSFLYTFGVCSSELIYDFLIMLSKRLTEVDVSTILTVLQGCGMRLRSDDPLGMKNFILNVQDKVNELKALSGEGQSNTTGKRMEFMLETICDIKNNKTRAKADNAQQTRMKKWLQKLRVDDILIRGLKWGKLLDPDKKGLWWLSGDIASNAENIEEVAGTIDKDIPETQKMLQLATAQRMNTDARRAIFCIIMSGEDYLDAFEKLLGLDLAGKQDREIMRVLVECCLQEKAFNKYYCTLASKLCGHDKNHKFTLQYCLWDHLKELESMQLIRSMHLAKFVAEMIASFSISLAVLKVVDLSDSTQLTAQRIMHFRMLFEAIFEFPDKIVWNVFTRIAVTPEYESLRHGIELFVSKYVIGFQKSFTSKFKIAKKALNNVEGILM